MNRIDDMIRQMCPDGVEYKPLGEIAELRRGTGMPKSTFIDNGVAAIHYGHIYTKYGAHTAHTYAHVTPAHAGKLTPVASGDLVIANTSENIEDVGKAVAWTGSQPAVTGGHATVLSTDQDTKFLSHYFRTARFNSDKRRYAFGTKVIELSTSNLAKIWAPIPPLELQHEIVTILDKFVALEAELEAELELRKQQYAYYLEKLLDFSNRRTEAPWRKLSDVGTFQRGKRFTKADYADTGTPCIHYGEIYTHYGVWADQVMSHLREDVTTGLRFAKPGDVVIVDVGEVADDVGQCVAWLGKEPAAIHDHCYIFRTDLNPVFVSYLLRTDWFRRQKAKHVARTKVKTLLIDGFSSISIPIPPRQEQDRIVEVLNFFDTLISDISSGLPAEIEARRQQYEYYRDKLLTFPEKAV